MGVYRFEKLPETVEEFKASPYFNLTDPHNTFAMFIVALAIYAKNQESGIECINILKGPEELSGYDKSFLKDRFRDKEYLPMAYFDGSTPENNYTPSAPFSITTIEDSAPQYTAGENFKRVFVKQAGFDNPRYITCRLKPSVGCWYLSEYSGILLGVKTPVADDPWA